MTPERWARLRCVFDELVELEPLTRAARLAALATTEPELHGELVALLGADAEAELRLQPFDTVLRPSPADGEAAEVEAADPLGLVGETVSHFRVVEALGVGGMGVVYRAQDKLLQRDVALKFPLPEHRPGREVRERFLREARAAGALDHPHLCSIYGAGETRDGRLYLAMALYEGETLETRLARTGPLAIDEVLDLGVQIAQGLNAAHRAGIVHRDLKPSNVIRLPDGTARILDFGLAAATAATPAGRPRLHGTIAYMAPEQVRGEAQVDSRTDLWALGVLLYELSTGERPFAGERDVVIASAIVHDDPLPPSRLRSGLDPDLERLMLRLLAKSPHDRPESAEAVASSLLQLRAAGTVPRRARPQLGLSVGASVLLVLLVLVGMVGRNRSTPVRDGDGAVRDDAVMVMPFRMEAGSRYPSFGEGLADLLSLRLTGEAGPHAIDMRSTLAALRTAAAAGDTALTPTTALRIARQAGAGQVLLGEIRESGDQLIATAVLHTGASRRTATASGPPDSLLSLADGLAVQLLSRAAGVDEQRLASLTSSSLDAVRAYLLGQSQYRRGEFERAVASFGHALDYDSTFALAALGLELSAVWGAPEMIGGRGRSLAVRYRERAPPRDRELIEALHVDTRMPPRVRLRMLEQYAQRYPDRPEGWVGLGEHLFHDGGAMGLPHADDLTVRALEQAIRADPQHPSAYLHLIDIHATRRDTIALRQSVESLRKILSDSAVSKSAATASLWLAAVVLGDQDQIAAIDSLLVSAPPHVLTSIPAYAVRSAAGLAEAEHVLDLAERHAARRDRLAHVYSVRSAFHFNTGRPQEGHAALRLRAALVDEPGATFALLIALAYPEADTTGAGAAERRLERFDLSGSPLQDASRHCVLGLLGARRGERPAAARLGVLRTRVLDNGATALLPCLRALEAIAAHQAGAPDASQRLAVLDSTLENSPMGSLSQDQWTRFVSVQLHRDRGEPRAVIRAANRICAGCFLHSAAVLERARAHARLDERDAAIEQYRQFLQLFEQAEPGPASELAAAARAELERLLER